MKNILVYIDPTTNAATAKTMASPSAAYEAMRRAGKQNIKALYCALADVEKTKADLMALAAKSAQATAPAAPQVTAPVAPHMIHVKEVLPVHMVVSTVKADGTKATIQYKDEAKAAAAYRAAKADPDTKVYAGYRTVTVRFTGSGLYTYLADRTVKTKTVNINTPNGVQTAYVVDNNIRSRQDLLSMAQSHGYELINDFFKVLEEV